MYLVILETGLSLRPPRAASAACAPCASSVAVLLPVAARRHSDVAIPRAVSLGMGATSLPDGRAGLTRPSLGAEHSGHSVSPMAATISGLAHRQPAAPGASCRPGRLRQPARQVCGITWITLPQQLAGQRTGLHVCSCCLPSKTIKHRTPSRSNGRRILSPPPPPRRKDYRVEPFPGTPETLQRAMDRLGGGLSHLHDMCIWNIFVLHQTWMVGCFMDSLSIRRPRVLWGLRPNLSVSTVYRPGNIHWELTRPNAHHPVCNLERGVSAATLAQGPYCN